MDDRRKTRSRKDRCTPNVKKKKKRKKYVNSSLKIEIRSRNSWQN